MQHYAFEQSVGYWTVITANAFQKALNDQLAPHGITFRQAQVLGCLALHGELSQVELASHMMIEPPTLVGILDRMERDGWIHRQACRTDRRRKVVQATPEADVVWEKVTEAAARVRARATRGLSPDQVGLLLELLSVVHHNLAPAVEPAGKLAIATE